MALILDGTAGITTPALSDSGNLTFTGTGNRILGDFSNATLANRVWFQTSTTNGASVIGALPNGTGTTTGLVLGNNSDPTNWGFFALNGTATDARLTSGISGTGTYLPMTFYTGGSERMRIDTSGNVGIGTSSPGGDATNRVVSASGSSSASFTSICGTVTTNYASVSGNGLIGTSSSHPLVFNTNNTERMRITASGAVGIANNNPAYPLDVNGAIGCGASIYTGSGVSTGDTSIEIGQNRTGDGNCYVDWHSRSGSDYDFRIIRSGGLNGGVTLTNAGAGGFGLIQEGAANMTFATNNAERMRIDSAGNVTLQNNISVGGAAPTTSGTGITFPATQSASSNANTLDDYEEGTWSPTVSSSVGTITSYTANGTYTKIGRLVTASIQISITNNGTGSGAIQATLPFAQASTSTPAIGCGRENALQGFMLQLLTGSNSNGCTIWTYNNQYPGGTNYSLNCTVTYFTAT